MIKNILVKSLITLGFINTINAQEQAKYEEIEPPKYSMFRAEENYDYLKNKENNPYKDDIFNPIKFIPLNQKKEIYLSFGGQLRPRFEHFENRRWESEGNENFYSQRLAVHSNLVIGRYFRIFGELYHGYITDKKEFAEYDELDFHQAFIEFKFPVEENQSLSFRFGRQEMAFGASRLIGLREGPNIRRTFDATRLIYKIGKINIQTFYGKETRTLFGTFDNKFTFFDGKVANPQLWGVYTQIPVKNIFGNQEFYYLGFRSNHSTFSDQSGKETRHTIGLRRFGKLGKYWNFNTELIYQFGKLGNNQISAFNIETDWHYELVNTAWRTSPGLKLEYTSGDKNTGDGKINTFNPLFVNPAYYSLAATITPVNMISVHPSVSAKPTEKLSLYAEWGFFWRASKNDGLYSPPRFIARPANGITDKSLGSQVGFTVAYEYNRHLSIDLDISYFIAGKFLKASGESENIFHFAPTLSYKF